jgi:hypothetical protein
MTDANQLNRRNVTPERASYIRGRIYNRVKKSSQDNLRQNLPKDQNDTSVNTAARLASEHGVSEATGLPTDRRL